MSSGFPETEQQFAGLKITCDTEFYIESDTTAYLKVGVTRVKVQYSILYFIQQALLCFGTGYQRKYY